MFVYSVKGKKIRNIIICFAVIIIASLFYCLLNRSDPYTVVAGDHTFNIKIEKDDDVKAFLEQFNKQVSDTPEEITTVRIPGVFNDTYAEYNALQLSQGFDLTKYMGQTCTKYTYSVLNYPDKDRTVNANVLVCGDKVIAADISETSYMGFMEGLWNEGS